MSARVKLTTGVVQRELYEAVSGKVKTLDDRRLSCLAQFVHAEKPLPNGKIPAQDWKDLTKTGLVGQCDQQKINQVLKAILHVDPVTKVVSIISGCRSIEERCAPLSRRAGLKA